VCLCVCVCVCVCVCTCVCVSVADVCVCVYWLDVSLICAGSATVLFTFHPTIVLATFRMFACHKVNVAGTDSRLASDFSAHCFDTQYIVHVCLVGVPMLLLYVIIPPLAAFLYMWHIPKDQILDGTKNLLLFLNMEYKPNYYWWFLVVILRKVHTYNKYTPHTCKHTAQAHNAVRNFASVSTDALLKQVMLRVDFVREELLGRARHSFRLAEFEDTPAATY